MRPLLHSQRHRTAWPTKDVNIDMLELMIEIRKKKVEQESEALRFLHRCIRRCETLRLEFDGNRGRFCAIERSGVVPGEYGFT